MLTKEQESYLAKLADKGIADEQAEAERIAKSDAESKAFIERQQFLADLDAQKKQEIADAIAAYDSGKK